MSGPMNLVYPSIGGDSGTWGLVLSTLLGQFGGGVENHDHSPGRGNLVPSAGLGINADVSWSQNAITNLLATQFAPVAASSVAGYFNAFFTNSSDGNLYWRNGSGSNVQVTSGAGLNLSATGGILGDYAGVAASLSYQDATKNYILQQEGSPRPFAGLETGDILLFEKAASITNAVTLKSPHALAASYAVTLPTAVPANQSIVQMGASGTLTASNTLASNQNLQLTGSGYLQRAATWLTQVPVWAGGTIKAVGSAATDNAGSTGAGVSIGASSTILIPLGPSSSEWRLKNVDVIVLSHTTGSGITLLVEQADNVTGGYDAIVGASTSSVTNGANNLTPSSPSTLQAPAFVQVATTAGSAISIIAIYAQWDIP